MENAASPAPYDERRVARYDGDALSAMLENAAGVALAHLDTGFNFIRANSDFASSCGLSSDALVGKHCLELFPDMDTEALFRTALEMGQRVELKARALGFEGRHAATGYWDWSLSPVRDDAGHVTSFVLSLVDVTDRHSRDHFAEALANLDVLIHSALDHERMISYVVDGAARAIGCDGAALALRRAAGWEAYRVTGGMEELQGRLLPNDAVSAVEFVAATRRTLVVDLADGDERFVGSLESFGVKSVLNVPLVVRDEVVGVLGFHRRAEPAAFSQAAVDFGSRLGASLSLAMANAELYERERRVAEDLQRMLVALPEHVPGLEIAHTYQPASEASMVGGDFCDVFEMEDETIGLTIGDISGKGVEAAVLTSLLKHTIRAHAVEEDKSPAEVMRLANRILFHSSPDDVFATVFFAELNRETGDLRYCNAGHPAGAILHPGGRVEPIGQTGPLVGAFARVHFADGEAVLPRASSLFLYTDGLIEARRDGGQFTEERVFERLASLAGATPAEIADGIIDEAVDFAGARMADDVATLVVRRA